MLLCTSLRDIFGLGHDEIKEIKVCSRQKQKSASAVKMCNEMASEVFLNFRKLNLTITAIITCALQSTMFLTAE